MVVVVFGLPGSGKSYFASRLADLIHADYIKSDKLRSETFDKKTYSKEEKSSVYDQMQIRMKEAVSKNRDVVLDATFYKDDIRRKFKKGIEGRGHIAFIEVTADEALIRNRLREPRTDSDADFEVFKKLKQAWDPLNEPHLVLESTNDNIEQMLHHALGYLTKNDTRTNQ